MHYQEKTREMSVMMVAILAGGALYVGCPREDALPPPETPTAEVRERAPDYQLFAPLPEDGEFTMERLPFLMTKRGTFVESSCFAPLEGEPLVSPTSDLEEPIARHERDVSRFLARWFQSKVSIAAVGDSDVNSWKIVPEEAIIREIDDHSVRFVENPGCIDPSTGWLESNVVVVAGLIGARSFDFTSSRPIPRKSAEALREEFTKAGMTFETEDLIDYELVVDDEGQPTKGSQGEKLYRSPDMGTVSELDIVPPARQKMKSWSITSDELVFFGFRELSKTAWRREADLDRCNVNIVWNDPTFRPPECAEYTASSFKASKRGDRVEIQMKTADQEEPQVFEMGFEELKKIQVSDRTILWLSPVTIEEGALIRLNSLVLDP